MNPYEAFQRVRQTQERTRQQGWYQLSSPTMAGGSSRTRLQIYGYIGDWWEGTDAATLARDIADLDVDEIEVHLNSPGGLAFDGIAIYNALRQHDANITCVVDGLAASAASIIAMAGDTVVMSLGAQMMIHDASGICFGMAADMRTTADWLDKLSQSGAEIYAAKAGGTAEQWRQAMLDESWYTAQEAVDAGLADQVGGKASADPEQAFDLSIYQHAGRSKAPRPPMPPAEPVEHHNPSQPSQEVTGMDPDEFISGLRQRLGVNADIDEAGVLSALDETLAEQANPTTVTAVQAVPEGMVLVEQSTLDALRGDATAGREARNQQIADRRAQLVQAAVADGRILPAQRENWVARLTADAEGMEPVLAGLPTGLLPLQEQGHAPGSEDGQPQPENVRETAAYKNWSSK